MLQFQWNALRVGDRVLVHDDHDPDRAPLVEGIVDDRADTTRCERCCDSSSGSSGGDPSTAFGSPPDRVRTTRLLLALRGPRRRGGLMTAWEYLIVSLPAFESAKSTQGMSASVDVLNHEGAMGWEAVGISPLADGTFAVLLKRPGSAEHSSGVGCRRVLPPRHSGRPISGRGVCLGSARSGRFTDTVARMRHWSCGVCGRPVRFDAFVCDNCGSALGYIPDELAMRTLTAVDDVTHTVDESRRLVVAVPERRVRLQLDASSRGR